ncbi:MAG: NAD(P)-dependent alcohol dehydrogenase [Leptospira sp.]|nr:NAD(P)-dependent alcohol dehydrogenase [Leptospira sp.]
MKAALLTNYGPPEMFQIGDIPTPKPKPNEILIRIKATSVNSGECRIRRPDPQLVRLFLGLSKPRNPVIGIALAGEVVEIGKNITKFKVGDRIYGMTGMNFGTYAEYKCLSEESSLDFIPDGITDLQAACVPFGGLTALHFLNVSNVKPQEKILIYGASGSVGTAAVQLAKKMNLHITAVSSQSNKNLLKSLGADEVLGYDEPGYKLELKKYDIIFEVVGKSNLPSLLKSLKIGGTLILCDANFYQFLWAFWKSIFSKYKMKFGLSSESIELLKSLTKLLTDGSFKPVIDKVYPLDNMVEAHRYADTGHKKGNIGIEIK